MINKKNNLIKDLRKTLLSGGISIGSWLQIPDTSVAEIMSDAGYDWLAIDCEHGLFNLQTIVEICRAIELHETLPLVRLPNWERSNCKSALEAGAAGVIVPMVENAQDVEEALNNCRWPPNGSRGVGFSRSNMFGKYFESSRKIAETPIFVAMIENKNAVMDIDKILAVDGLDAIFIGPYDLSASLGCIGDFTTDTFNESLNSILKSAAQLNVPVGIHVVDPDLEQLSERIRSGFRFNAYSVDAVFMREACKNPILK